MKFAMIPCLGVLLAAATLHAAELHVGMNGDDSNSGTQTAPLRTIQRAADLAQPGDTITVHEGVYRERINPPRGGESDAKRIVYQAAPDERVEIKGSEIVGDWAKLPNGVWKTTLPNSFFGDFNPFADLIHGDWFNPNGREHHTGAVYLNGEWLVEAASLDDVPAADGDRLWFAQVDDDTTTIRAQFGDVDPNEQLVEVNVRRTVFYPDAPGRNYITIRGFTMRHAATPWAPPTAEQIGLIGTHWSKGWIIENNVISHSTCSGIALGKHGDEFDNTSADTAEGYVLTIERAHAHEIAWTKENIGHHVVRNNTVSHCEQAGIVGSLGAAFSTVTDNTVHDVHVRRLFGGAEMAGIKLHGAIDATIARNHVYNTCRGLWLDWMAQGTRVSRNLFHDNLSQDLFMEVNHGPFLVDNNLFLSPTALLDMSEGGAYVHNLFAGRITSRPVPNRETPYHPAHSTTVAGLKTTRGGDNRFYNNILLGPANASAETPTNAGWQAAGYGLWVYDTRELALRTGGNVYLGGARPYARETDPLLLPDWSADVKLSTTGDRLELQMTLPESLDDATTTPVTTALLGKAEVPGLPYVSADDSPLTVDIDYFGKPRGSTKPTPGPFENPGHGVRVIDVYPME